MVISDMGSLQTAARAFTRPAARRRRLGIRCLALVTCASLLIGMADMVEPDVPPHNPIDSIVMVSNGTGHGAGVVVDAKRGHILTNAHVIGHRKEVVVKFRDGREVLATVLRRAGDNLDLVLLKIALKIPIKSASVSCRSVETAENVVAIGHPGPFRWAVSKGYVAARYSKSKLLGEALVLDLTIWHGNSGGGLFDTRGRLVGITTAIFGQRRAYGRVYSGFSFAVSGPDMCRFLKRAPAKA